MGGVDAGTQTISALEVDDVGPLIVVLRLLEEQRLIQMRDWGHAPLWPERTPPIVPKRNIRENLSRLAHCEFITIAQGGLIDYGAETIRIASKWGIVLSEEREAAAV
jgi:hypothetical protein